MDGRVLVVGAAMAGLRTAEALRARGHTGEIVLVGDEPHAPYTRPPLSKTLLTKASEHADVAFPVRASVADVVWHRGRRVGHADLDARVVHLDDGRSLTWDTLVAATGVRPRRLPAPGPRAGRHTIRTLEDSATLQARLRPGSQVVVVGAGFIGCEVAATARALGAHVTVVAADAEPMARPLGTMLGAALRRRHEAAGVVMRLGTGLEAFLGEDVAEGVRLSDGTEVRADVVVEAVGSTCNTEWLEGNGLDLSDGVLTDGALRADHAAPLLAVGDVARYPNRWLDAVPRRIEHWQLATETGKVAAATILSTAAGEEPGVVDTVPYFWSDQHELKLQAFGSPAASDEVTLLEGDLEDECAVGYERDGRLVAVVLVGLAKRAVHYRRMLADRASVSTG